jgi:predicted nucleotidyltransferase
MPQTRAAIEEIDVLDVKRIDLASLAEALEDHSFESTWWFDPDSGQIEPWIADPSLDGEDEESPEERGMIEIDALPSGEGYRDMEDFVSRVRDPRARNLLSLAIQGRGAFRRFKDTLLDFPQLRDAWFPFHDVRMERRALEWLATEQLIEKGVAEREIARRPDPDLPPLSGAFDAEAIARSTAEDLRSLYGSHLRSVVLFGSWARGDAHTESDIDLLVVLDELGSPWEELRLMDTVLWRHSLENDTVVSAVAVSEADLVNGRRAFLRQVQAEGHPVA